MDGIDYAGIIVAIATLLTTIGLGCKWLITFIETQANATNEMLRSENDELKARIEILEIKLQARNGGDP